MRSTLSSARASSVADTAICGSVADEMKCSRKEGEPSAGELAEAEEGCCC